MDGINFRDYNFNIMGNQPQIPYPQYLVEEFNPFNFSGESFVDTFSTTKPIPEPVNTSPKTLEIDINPKQADEISYILETIEANLNKRFPNGYKLVGIGRSPSLIIDLMREKGYEAISVPISGLSNSTYDINGNYPYLLQLNSADVKAYGDYIKELGVDTQHLQGKTLVFVDYTRTGTSLKSFEDLIKRSEIGLQDKSKMAFLSLNRDLMPNHSLKDLEIISS